MKTLFVNDGCAPIRIGFMEEDRVVRVAFPITEIVNEVGNGGSWLLLNRRPTEEEAYACPLSQISYDDNWLYWIISSSDVQYPGNGQVQLMYSIGDAVKMSKVFKTIVAESITDSGNVPSYTESWIRDLNDIKAETEQARDSIVNMSVSATSLESSEEASVEKEVDPDTGAISLNFGIPAGDQNVFIAVVNETTYDEISTAANDGKIVLAQSSSNKVYTYMGISSNRHQFISFGSGSSPQRFGYSVDTSNVWTYSSNLYLVQTSTNPSSLDADTSYAIKKADSNRVALEPIEGGTSNVFIAEYGLTTHEEITEAIAEKKLVVCYVDEGDEDVICYIYDGANSKNLDHWFHCFNSGISTIKKCVYCATDSTWHSVSYDYQNVFIAKYNETTYDELTTALTTNKAILCVNGGITYEYSGTVSGKAYFSNLSTGSSPLKRSLMLDANGWTSATYPMLMLNQQPSQYDATKKYNVQRVSASSNQFKLVEATSGGGGGSATMLWANPSPASEFGEQTIQFTNDSYKFIEVKFIVSSYNKQELSIIFTSGGASHIVEQPHFQNDDDMSTYHIRYTSISSDMSEIAFASAVFRIDESENNAYLIPVAIIGWK